MNNVIIITLYVVYHCIFDRGQMSNVSLIVKTVYVREILSLCSSRIHDPQKVTFHFIANCQTAQQHGCKINWWWWAKKVNSLILSLQGFYLFFYFFRLEWRLVSHVGTKCASCLAVGFPLGGALSVDFDEASLCWSQHSRQPLLMGATFMLCWSEKDLI